MILFHIVIISLIQGITEFLPISSSGHLGLFHCFTDQCDTWDAENLTMDIAVHVGTLFSVLLYFRADVAKMLFGLRDLGTGQSNTSDSRLLIFVLISSIPVVVAGLLLSMFEPDWLKTLHVIAWTTLGFGIVLWIADTKFPEKREITTLTYKDAIIIGLVQMLALIPGTSRSGITMTAARFLGITRSESARYSLLLAMVAISGAGLIIGLKLLDSGDLDLGLNALIAMVLSFISGLLAITLMMKFLEKCSFTVFAIYRVILGGGLLVLLYTGVIG